MSSNEQFKVLTDCCIESLIQGRRENPDALIAVLHPKLPIVAIGCVGITPQGERLVMATSRCNGAFRRLEGTEYPLESGKLADVDILKFEKQGVGFLERYLLALEMFVHPRDAMFGGQASDVMPARIAEWSFSSNGYISIPAILSENGFPDASRSALRQVPEDIRVVAEELVEIRADEGACYEWMPTEETFYSDGSDKSFERIWDMLCGVGMNTMWKCRPIDVEDIKTAYINSGKSEFAGSREEFDPLDSLIDLTDGLKLNQDRKEIAHADVMSKFKMNMDCNFFYKALSLSK